MHAVSTQFCVSNGSILWFSTQSSRPTEFWSRWQQGPLTLGLVALRSGHINPISWVLAFWLNGCVKLCLISFLFSSSPTLFNQKINNNNNDTGNNYRLNCSRWLSFDQINHDFYYGFSTIILLNISSTYNGIQEYFGLHRIL